MTSQSSGLLTLVINLDDARQRLIETEKQLGDAGLSFERFAAIDGRKRGMADWAEYDPDRALRVMGGDLTSGEIACYLSHVKALNRFMETDKSQLLVLEDDVLIPVSSVTEILQVSEWLEHQGNLEWDVVNFSQSPSRFYTPVAALGMPNLNVAHYFPLWTSALLWSRSGAAAFLRDHDAVFAPVDRYLRSWCSRRGKGFACAIPPVRQSGATSQLSDENEMVGRERKRRRNQLSYQRAVLRRQSAAYCAALMHQYRWRLLMKRMQKAQKVSGI